MRAPRGELSSLPIVRPWSGARSGRALRERKKKMLSLRLNFFLAVRRPCRPRDVGNEIAVVAARNLNERT